MAEPVPGKKRVRKPDASAVTMTSPAAILAAEPAVTLADAAEAVPAFVAETPAETASGVDPVVIEAAASSSAIIADSADASEPADTSEPIDEIAAPLPAAAAVEIAPVPEPVPAVASIETAPAPVDTPLRPLAGTLTKGLHIMATTFDSTVNSEKAKAVFGDINDRAKTAMEKSAKFGEEVTEFTKGNVEAIVASGRVAAKGAETIAQDVAETMKKHFESATAQMKSIASVKSPTELFQLQSDFAKSYFDSAVADASKFSESMMKLAGDIAQPLSSRYAVAAEKFKATAL